LRVLMKIPFSQKEQVTDECREHAWRIGILWSGHERNILP